MPPPHPWGALVTACLALFLIAVNTTAINTAVSAIADDLTLSSTTLGWALNAYLLAVAAFVVLGGQLGDVLGRKRIFVIGIAVYTLAAVVVASSGSAAQLIGGRAMQGAGAAILMPATMAILHDAFPKEEQGRVLGIWGAVGGVAFAVGPLIGGFFTDALSWRWVWWSNVPVAIVALVLAGPMLRGLSSGKRGVRFDVAGIVLLAVGLFTAILALQQGSRWGWTSPLLLAKGTLWQPGRRAPKRSRNSRAPFSDSAPVVSPWNAWSAKRMRGRRVAQRAYLTTVSTDSEPLFVKKQR